MKNLSLILSIVALAISGFLFVGKMTGNGGGNVAVDAQSAGKIAYVNFDSLQTQYNLFLDQEKELQKKQQSAEADFKKRVTDLAVKEERFLKQYKGGLLSANEAQKKQQELQLANQELQEYQASVRQGLLSLSQEKQELIMQKVTNFLEEYNKTKGYSYIIKDMTGGILLIADKGQNITNEVIEGLNKAYENEKGSTEKSEEGK